MRVAQTNGSKQTISSTIKFALRTVALGAVLLALLTVAASTPRTIHAQTQLFTPNYWQQDVDNPINALTTVDFEGDGFEEFVVISGEQTVEIVRGDGSLAWEEPLISNAPILAATNLATVLADGDSMQRIERLALASAETIWVVNADQRTEWSIGIDNGLTPIALQNIPVNDQGEHGLVAQFSNGDLHVYTREGRLAWRYAALDDNPDSETAAHLLIDDIDRDGQVDLIYGVGRDNQDSENPIQVGYIDRIDSSTGRLQWRKAVDGPVSAIATASADEESAKQIAVGDTLGNLTLLNEAGDAVWRTKRTLNRPITSIVSTDWPRLGPLVLVGTDTGKLVAYNLAGVRIWDKVVCRDEAGNVTIEDLRCATAAAGTIARLEVPATPRPASQPLQLALLAVSRDSAEILLIDGDFRSLGQYPAAILANNARLVDVNNDRRQELILANFTTLELLSTGTSARTPIDNWGGYLLRRGQSTAMVAHDLNGDDAQELLVAAADRLHLLRYDGELIWLRPIDGTISHLEIIDAPPPAVEEGALQAAAPSAPPYIVVTYETTDENGAITSFLTLFKSDSSPAWDEPLEIDGRISTLTIDRSDVNHPHIFYGTDDSDVNGVRLARSVNDPQLWDGAFQWPGNTLFGRAVTNIGTVMRDDRVRVIASTTDEVVLLDRENGQTTRHVPVEPSASSTYCATGSDLFELLMSGSADNVLCNGQPVRTAINDGQSCTDCWETLLGRPTDRLQNLTQRFSYLPLNATTLQQRARLIDIESQEFGDITTNNSNVRTFDNVQAFVAGNFRGGSQQDVAIVSNGELWLDLNTSAITKLDLGFSVIDAVVIQSAASEAEGLVISADNGRIYLYKFQPNFPPLLTNPVIQLIDDSYDVQVSLFDVENSAIEVELQVLNQNNGEWETKGVRTRNSNINQLNWQLDNVPLAQPIQYRFSYREPAGNSVTLLPLAGPPPDSGFPWYIYLSLPAGVLLAAFSGAIIYRRRRRQPETYARTIYHQIAQTPEKTLIAIRRFYDDPATSTDQLLALANEFRNNSNLSLANIIDGLYLLANQPHAGLPIITKALNQLASFESTSNWQDVDRWQATFGSAQTLLESPTLTELTLQKELLTTINRAQPTTEDEYAPYDGLEAVMGALESSERVDSAEDRLTYLNDGNALLRKASSELGLQRPTLNTRIASALAARWMALVRAEIESLRGKARLEIELRTSQVQPSAETAIVIAIANKGRAPAEEITVTLQDGAAKAVQTPTVNIPYLAAGTTRHVTFNVDLSTVEAEQFRLVFSVTYNDRASAQQTVEYANIVNVLAPLADYVPIVNPYSPGTPLRQNSQLFFGRTDLFNFIASEAKRLTQKHVLILVGQRRTGKTSALLRLGQHLPEQILAVYVDCQSLGVIPGMSAFFQDLAWQVADAIEMRGIEFDLPDMAEITENPGNWFQRELLPAARAVLPADTQILLVFDEFEALENLVDDGILPNTIFPYLRHLMQHGEKLSFIFVGTRRLEALTTNYWSVLFNIALYKEINYLSRSASRQLMLEPTEPHMRYDELAIDKVWRLTAGHPYFLQLVCYSVVKRANQTRNGYVTISDVNATISEMLQLGEVHFAYIWQGSTFAERAILLAVAHLIDRELPFAPADISEALTPFVKLTPPDITKALNLLVERNIMQEVTDGATTLYALNIGLIGSWIEQTKSLTQLYRNQISVQGGQR